MLVACIVLAAVAATPVATPKPTPVPAIRAGTGQTRTLADVARERRVGVPGVKGGAFTVTSASGASDALAGQSTGSAPPARAGATPQPWEDAVAYDESWRERAKNAQAELGEAEAAEARASAAIPAVTFSGRGAAAAQALADQQRAAALAPYREKIGAASEKIRQLKEDAAKAGVPGLVR